MSRHSDTANSAQHSKQQAAGVDVNVNVEADGDVDVVVNVDVDVFPRTDVNTNYYLTRHAGQRLRDDDRELSPDIIRNTIRDGRIVPAKGDAVAFEFDIGPTTYTVIVGTERDSDGFPIITAYPDFDEPDLSRLPDEHF